MAFSASRLGRGCLALLLLGVALLACRGAPPHKCFAAIEYDGKRYSAVGTGGSKDSAGESALFGGCGWHCELDSPAVRVSYDAYRAKGGKQAPEFARHSDPGLKAAMRKCQATCQAAIQGKSARSQVECL